MARTRRQRGATLVELAWSLAVLGLIVTISVSAIGSMVRRAALRSAAQRLRTLMQETQINARALSSNCAIKFTLHADGWYYAVYIDGNDNGVTNSDIVKGLDPPLLSERPLHDENGVSAGILPGEPDPDGGPPLTSPVKFNSSALCSFSQTGSSTPGTIYLTDGTDAIAVRTADDGRIRILVYVSGSGQWVDL